MSMRGKRHTRAIFAVAGAAALLAGLPGCRGKEPQQLAARPVSTPSATSASPEEPRQLAASPVSTPSATNAASTLALRCQELPGGDSASIPWPPASARRADFPSPLNSDGTRKRLPPPPPNEPGHTLLFQYNDFGPQAMQLGLLGQSWWSWEAGGSFAPGDEFDVRVVVYQGRTRKDIERRYPTIKGESDYRLIQRDEALRYLDEQITELEAMSAAPDGYDFGPLRRELEQVRSTILGCLPAAAAPGGQRPAP